MTIPLYQNGVNPIAAELHLALLFIEHFAVQIHRRSRGLDVDGNGLEGSARQCGKRTSQTEPDGRADPHAGKVALRYGERGLGAERSIPCALRVENSPDTGTRKRQATP